jgi:DAK2 domain fusion protein YloV
VNTPRQIALAATRGGATALEASRAQLNDLNVFPVPDGDTGSNLTRTAVRLADGLEGGPAASLAEVAAAAKRSALAGASGNSGIILSQIVAGFADVLGQGGTVDADVLARALRAASDAAYRPVRQPIEGTMLTLIREMAETAERHRAAPLDAAIDAVLEAASETVTRTESMLAVLRDAHVVDAGAAGLLEFARGAVAGYRGEAPREPAAAVAAPVSLESVHLEESQYRYCTSFLIEADAIDVPALEQELAGFGDCVLVVGEAPLVKVHVHTDEPGLVLSLGVAIGAVDGIEIANMHEQARAREQRLTVIQGGDSRADPLAATAAIVLDSTADLPDPQTLHPHWRSVPLTVSFGDRDYADGVDIDSDGFYDLLRRSAEHPQTSAPSPGAYQQAFAQVADCARVFVMPISSKVSASYQSAVTAAQDDARVTVLDGRSVSAGTVMLAEGVQRLIDAGEPTDAIEAWLDGAGDRMRLLVGVTTLEYLERGGRISHTQRLLGDAFGVKTLLTMRDGEVVKYKTTRGVAGIWREFERFIQAEAPADRPVHVGIAHAQAPEAAARLSELVVRLRPEAEIERVCSIGAVVGAHSGPGAFGLLILPDA